MIDGGSLRLWFAFGGGVATFFAPCAIPLLPGYVAFFVGREATGDGSAGERFRRAVAVGSFASLCFLLVFVGLFGVAFALGSRVLAGVALFEPVVGVALVVLGAAMALDRDPSPTIRISLPARRRSPAGYVAFGAAYAAAAAGCTGPLFVGIASVGIAGGPRVAVATLAAYAAGMSALLILVTALAALGRDAALGRLTTTAGSVTRAAGVALAGAGVVQLYWFFFVFEGARLLRDLFTLAPPIG